MNLQTPIGPDLPITAARQFAIEQIDANVCVNPELVTAFWDEVNGATVPNRADITVFYCFLKFEGATFTLLEFVMGQTLQELCVAEEPEACERVIPLFSRLLDAYDGAMRAIPNGFVPNGTMQLSGFGIARATAPGTANLHGTMLVRPDGSWCEDVLSGEGGRSAAYPLLMAVYKELVGGLPKGAPLVPAQLASFTKRALNKPVSPLVSRKALPYLTAVGACTLLLVGLFGLGSLLSSRAKSKLGFGLNLPRPEMLADTPAVSPTTQSLPGRDRPAKETLVINEAGLSRGPRLIRQPVPVYPPAAKEQKISGVVTLEVTVAEDGSVWATKILAGIPLLAQSAAEAVKKWVYQPALVNGKPSSSTTEVEIKFDLAQAN
jgi:TonB family protein